MINESKNTTSGNPPATAELANLKGKIAADHANDNPWAKASDAIQKIREQQLPDGERVSRLIVLSKQLQDNTEKAMKFGTQEQKQLALLAEGMVLDLVNDSKLRTEQFQAA